MRGRYRDFLFHHGRYGRGWSIEQPENMLCEGHFEPYKPGSLGKASPWISMH